MEQMKFHGTNTNNNVTYALGANTEPRWKENATNCATLNRSKWPWTRIKYCGTLSQKGISGGNTYIITNETNWLVSVHEDIKDVLAPSDAPSREAPGHQNILNMRRCNLSNKYFDFAICRWTYISWTFFYISNALKILKDIHVSQMCIYLSNKKHCKS